MKRFLPISLTLAFLLTSLLTIAVPAQTPRLEQPESSEAEDDAPVQRVARLSLLEGDVSFLRAGVSEWAQAAENLPLFTGDQIYTGRGARAEIQLGRGNYIRLSESTALTLTELSHTAAQFDITEGIAIVRLERFGTAFERFEIDTPNSALVFEQDGLYRVNVRGENESEIISRRGSIDVTTTDGSFKVREGNRLLIDTNGRLEISQDTSRDSWDQWSTDRDTTVDRVSNSPSAVSYLNIIETVFNCFYGASELSSHGSWYDDSSYGDCWVPRVGSGWAPYRNGQWIWSPRVGWSWLASEPWGWAPYHYGRWVMLPQRGWAWVPGLHRGSYRYGHSYYQWRPALVYFFNYQTPRGNYVGWYPLTPGERWRRHDSYRRQGDHSHLQYPLARDNWRRPRVREGLTVLPVEGFTRPDRSAARPEAPARDTDRWLDNGARAGLPEVAQTGSAFAPVWRGGDGRARPGRVVAPATEVINRPVVTRNRPADTQTANDTPRERRLILPRKERGYTEVPAPNHRRSHDGDHATPSDDQTRGGERERREERRGSSGDDSEGRKRERRENQNQQPPAGNRDRAPVDSSGDKRERHERPTVIPDKRSRDSSDDDQNNRREKKRPADERPRDDSQSNPDRQSRPRPSEDSSQRTREPREDRSSQRSEQKEERRQEKQEQREQRKKGNM
jgi:uncharacterized protein DUF6600